MNIRKAEKKDIPAILDLLGQVQEVHANGRPDIFKGGTKKYSEQEVLDIISNSDTPVFVYTDKTDKAVGYVFCILEEQKDSGNLRARKNFYIDDLCVDEKLRGQGIGKKLYEYAVGVAKELNCYHLTLNVWHLNQSAVKFYEKLGMSPLKTTMEQILR